MSYQGDIAEDATFRFTFNTRTTAGAPITIGGTAAAECYKDSNLTQTGTGVAITEDYDGVTGLHQCVMTLTDAFYVTGSDYSIVMSVGTVDSQSIVGETIATFSIENRWDLDTAKASALATVDSEIGVIDGIVDTILVDTADMQPRVAAIEVTTDKFVFTAANQVDAQMFASATDSMDAATITADFSQEIADGIFTRQMTESYSTDGVAPTLAQSLMLIQQMLGDFSISGTTMSIKGVDGTTEKATFTLSDDTNPTSLTRAT